MNFDNLFKSPALQESIGFEIDWDAFSSSVLIEVKRDDSIFTSSAVVIRRNIILTAAHSVEGIKEGYVHLGNEFHLSNEKIAFKKVIIHEDYDQKKSNYAHDLALIILDGNLPTEFRPIRLAQSLNGETLDRIGFGGRNGRNARTWTNPKVTDVAFGTIVLEDHLSVIGDSGGPLYSEQGLVGIHSTLEGSNKTYAVFIPHYMNWIEANLPLKEVHH